MPGLSLWTIEESLVELLSAREELIEALADPDQNDPVGERPAELAEVEKALAEYVGREVAKVDGIHGYLKYATATAAAARQEAREMAERARRLEDNAARLKALCVDIMTAAGKKKLEGTAGRALRVQANGGLAPLVVDPAVLPAEYCDATIAVPANLLPAIREALGSYTVRVVSSAPANERIRAALAEGPVPGAHLGERGSHLRIV